MAAMASSVNRYLICVSAFLLGSALMAAVYLGFLTWAQGWDYAFGQFVRDRAYVLPIIVAFGIQTALYSVLRYRLFMPAAGPRQGVASTAHTGAVVGTNGATSSAAMIACCLHHVTNVLPILGVSAAAGFLARYQRPFMLVSLGMNLVGILAMLLVLDRARRALAPSQIFPSLPETR